MHVGGVYSCSLCNCCDKCGQGATWLPPDACFGVFIVADVDDDGDVRLALLGRINDSDRLSPLSGAEDELVPSCNADNEMAPLSGANDELALPFDAFDEMALFRAADEEFIPPSCVLLQKCAPTFLLRCYRMPSLLTLTLFASSLIFQTLPSTPLFMSFPKMMKYSLRLLFLATEFSFNSRHRCLNDLRLLISSAVNHRLM